MLESYDSTIVLRSYGNQALTDSVNIIRNVQTTPWHWYSVKGLIK